ncbi:MAG: semialdehyde dehydrogenase [Candidatus Poribacteria bacterium]|nr:MAG: semialdehyde dehydrogenase [Candidatus Poribacteria bacterium]
MITLALLGAAGAMGTRIANALKGDPEFRLFYVETPEGEEKLRSRGLTPTPLARAVHQSVATIFAVRDDLIGSVAAQAVPHMRRGAVAIFLDPAAPYAGKLPKRSDVAYFVTHPAHPPIFHDETDPRAIRDYWGDGYAKQAIVSALIQGPEKAYSVGEYIAKRMFRPVSRSYRLTLEQMILLEPPLVETVAATCLTVIREAMDEVIRRGVPADAARDFLLGHLKVELAIVFNEINWEFSMGAKKAIEEAKQTLFQPDWKERVFSPEAIRTSVAKIVGDLPT